jgi:hypothetical protein
LRLEAGSTEAGFLAAFSDVSSVPTFVVIHNGQLQLQLKSDATKIDFINSIRRVLGANPIPSSSAAPTSPPQASTPEAADSAANAEAADDLYGLPEPSIPTLTSNTQLKQRATDSPSSTLQSTSVSKAQQEARDALRRKKREDAEELARIKARIEADKAARRIEAELRKAEREKEKNKDAARAPDTSRPVPASSRGTRSKTVALNVRLFDGRTIRSTFPRSATLQTDVRSWIDTEFGKLAQDDENINHKQLPPYFFRHILAPAPSRELSAGDEAVELGDIDLAPSATLVLVPVKGYTDAYSGSTGGVIAGAATGIVGSAFGLLTSTVGYVGSTIGSVIGYGAQPDQGGDGGGSDNHGVGGRTMGSRPTGEPSHDPVLDQTTSGGMRVRTLADQRARDVPQQFYNGNQLSTEPRPEDNDKRD